VDLVVQQGRPLRIALDGRIRLRGVGQIVSGTLIEPVYAYDRIVLPAGTKVLGHVAKLEAVPPRARVHAILNGDFTPLHRATLTFDSLAPTPGAVIPIRTEVKSATERVTLQARSAAREKGIVGATGDAVAGRAKDTFEDARRTLTAIKRPGRLQRLKQALVGGLPYHPQYLSEGTVYTAELLAPLRFGVVDAIEAAPSGTAPAPASILQARLLTALDSARSARASAAQAALIAPLFSADHRLILPEGTILTGEVTYARRARAFHRNGQLRFLFQTVQVPAGAQETMRASLYSAQVSRNQRVAIDDEGGATIENSKARFLAPALGTLALAASLHRRVDYDTDGLGPESQYGSVESRGLGGLFGLGFLGAGLSQISRPVAVALGAVGVMRTVYGSVFGRGREVTFPIDTVIEVQLGAEPARAPTR
jgi:hypothetical protein